MLVTRNFQLVLRRKIGISDIFQDFSFFSKSWTYERIKIVELNVYAHNMYHIYTHDNNIVYIEACIDLLENYKSAR